MPEECGFLDRAAGGAVTPVPGRRRVGLAPEAGLARSGFLLVEGVGEAILFALLPLVLLEMPGEADRELCAADVQGLRAGFALARAGVAHRCDPDFADQAIP